MDRVIGLTFHGIGRPGRELEGGESPYWLSEAQFTAVLDRIAAAPDPSAFALTFDDSNLSDYEIALPALKARGLCATIFVLTGRVGAPGSLDAAHIRELEAAGMRIGSHGIAHRAWPALEPSALTRELRESKTVLDALCAAPATEAAIPFGRYDARVLEALGQAGYTAVWSSDGGLMRREAFLRPRTSLRGDRKPGEIDALLAGRVAPSIRLRQAVRGGRRLWRPLGGRRR